MFINCVKNRLVRDRKYKMYYLITTWHVVLMAPIFVLSPVLPRYAKFLILVYTHFQTNTNSW